MLALPHAGNRGRKNHRVQRWRLQLVANRPINGLGVEKMVAVNGLRCALPSLYFLFKHAGGHDDRVQKGALAEMAMRVWRTRAQQQGWGVDGATRKNIIFCYYFSSYSFR